MTTQEYFFPITIIIIVLKGKKHFLPDSSSPCSTPPSLPLTPHTHSEGALCAFAGALRQASSAHAGRDPASYPGAPVTVGPHHGLHRVAPDTHGSLEGWRGNGG